MRYPSGIMAAGAGLWYLYSTRQRLSLFMGLALGATLALALVHHRSWGYGPRRSRLFVSLSEFHRGQGCGYATAPFFAYLYLPLDNSMASRPWLLSAATLIAGTASMLSSDLASAPYVAVLCILAHKETRFLYPLAPFLPFFVVFALAPEPKARFASEFKWLASGDAACTWGYAWNACGFSASVHFVAPGIHALPDARNQELRDEGLLEVAVVHPPDRKPYWYLDLHHALSSQRISG